MLRNFQMDNDERSKSGQHWWPGFFNPGIRKKVSILRVLEDTFVHEAVRRMIFQDLLSLSNNVLA